MVLSLVAAALVTGATPTVASPEWNAVNVKKELVTFYADALAEALRKQGLKVVTAQDIATLLGMERQKQLLGCDESSTSCMAELANALGCEATLVVNVARFDDGSFRGIAKLLGSRDGGVLSSVKLDSGSEKRFLDALEDSAEVLARPLLPKVGPQKPGFSRFWWIPGALGAVGAGVGAALLVDARAQYDAIPGTASRLEAEQLAEHGKGSQFVGGLALGVGAGLLVAGAVMALWPASPVTPQVALTPGGASLAVGGTF